jgi:alanine dehydrogenase
MIIGVPKEIKPRVALLPSAAYQLIKRGHRVVVETNAGAGSGFPDGEYLKAGAEVLATHTEVFAQADMIVKVKEPLPAEFPLLRPGQILFTYLHLAASKPLTEALAASRAACIAYETVEVNRRLPLLEPMSEIAGRMSVLVGGYFLAKHEGGCGVLLGGVPGVLPGKVVVIGGGTAGVNAARMAQGLGADVTILEVDVERMRFLDITLHTAHTLYSNRQHILDMLPAVDLLIGAVLVPGSKAPKLIDREMMRVMNRAASSWTLPLTRAAARRRRVRRRTTIRSLWRKKLSIIAWPTCPPLTRAPPPRRSPMSRTVTWKCWPIMACPALSSATLIFSAD